MFKIAAEHPDLEGHEQPLRGLIEACLAKDPADRPAPEDVIAGVQPIAAGYRRRAVAPGHADRRTGAARRPVARHGHPALRFGSPFGRPPGVGCPPVLPEDPTSAFPQSASGAVPSSPAAPQRRFPRRLLPGRRPS